MDTFDQKIYDLSQKLLSLSHKPAPTPPSPQQLLTTLSTLGQRIEEKQKQLKIRYKELSESLQLYETELDRIGKKCEANVERLGEENGDFVGQLKRDWEDRVEEFGRMEKRVRAECEENAYNERLDYESKFKLIRKQIEKQLASVQKQLKNLQDNPQLSLLESENKVYKQYYHKLTLIEQNQKKKAQKLLQLESKVQKRINKLYQNISTLATNQQSQLRSKYEKMRRLIALVTDLS